MHIGGPFVVFQFARSRDACARGTGGRGATPVRKSFQTPRHGKTATKEIRTPPQTVHPLHIPKDMKNIGRY